MKFTEILKTFENKKGQILANEKGIIYQSNLMLALCHSCLNKLKQAVLEQGFKNQASEVRFFKHTKPKIVSEHLFYRKARTLELSIEKRCTKSNHEKIMGCQKTTQEFLQGNIEFCQYLELGHTCLDEKYFTLQNGDQFIPKDNHVYYIDPEFSTTHSGLLAQVIANQKLMVHYKNTLDRVSNDQGLTVYPQTPIKWTKSKVALIDLIYALYWDNAIEHGNANLNKIVLAFEKLFDVQLPNPYKIYTEIKSREKTKTKFLEELMATMNTKINEVS